jgi:hypothetical protein
MRMLFRLARAWELGLQARQKTKITSSHRQLRDDVVIGIWRVRRAVHVRIMGIFVAQLKVCDAPFQRLEVRLRMRVRKRVRKRARKRVRKRVRKRPLCVGNLPLCVRNLPLVRVPKVPSLSW